MLVCFFLYVLFHHTILLHFISKYNLNHVPSAVLHPTSRRSLYWYFADNFVVIRILSICFELLWLLQY